MCLDNNYYIKASDKWLLKVTGEMLQEEKKERNFT